VDSYNYGEESSVNQVIMASLQGQNWFAETTALHAASMLDEPESLEYDALRLMQALTYCLTF